MILIAHLLGPLLIWLLPFIFLAFALSKDKNKYRDLLGTILSVTGFIPAIYVGYKCESWAVGINALIIIFVASGAIKEGSNFFTKGCIIGHIAFLAFVNLCMFIGYMYSAVAGALTFVVTLAVLPVLFPSEKPLW